MKEYDEELCCNGDLDLDIIKISRTFDFVDKFTGGNLDVIWDRNVIEPSGEEKIDQLIKEFNESPGIKVTKIAANGKTRCILID